MPSSSFDKHFAHLRISLEKIKSATNSFSDAHLIRTGGFGQEYEGQLELSGQLIDIVARRFDNKHGQGSKEFQIAILMLSSLKHENLVSIIGFCDEGREQIIINKRDAKGSLDQYLRDPSLTWIRRLEICVGVARALSYLHYDKKREFSVIHRNIKSCNVLVDDNWKPKLSGFEHSMKTTSRRHRLLLSGLCGTFGYIDPVYEKTGGVTHKSDVYSFGVVLFEVLCGRKSSINREGLSSQLAEKEMGKGDQIVKHEGNSGQLIKPHSKGAEMIKPSINREGLSSELAEKEMGKGDQIVKHDGNSGLLIKPHSKGAEMIKPHSTELYGPTYSGGFILPVSSDLRPLQHSTDQLINTLSGFVHKSWSAFNDLYGEMEAPGISDVQRHDMSSILGPDVYSQEMYMFTIPPSGRFRRNLYFSDEEFLAPLAISGYDQGKLDAMIDPHLRKQMDPQSFQVFSETAYYCLKEQRSQRPDMTQVFIKLKEALDHQRKYENHEHSEATSTNHLKGEDLKQLEIPLHDIKSATGSFSKGLIGAGTFGEVYKAELDHFDRKRFVEEKIIGELPKKRSTVAIKRIKIRDDKQGEEGFLAEIELLTSCNHRNIVSLLGFCKEDDNMILVYEHALYGSLDRYLGSAGSLTNLTWEQRVKICIDIAQGLNYLHTKIEGEGRIIHRDIKSNNILLGDNWEAKIADFGLSTFRNEDQQMNKTVYTNHVAGTEFYLDPEYDIHYKFKNESDIYSFGVVLFEMMSGKFAYDPIFTNENSKGIAHVARRRFKEGINSIKGMVDPRLMEETQDNTFTLNKGPDQDSLYAFSEIAYQCVAETQAERPTAEVVVKKLEEALSFQKNHKDRLQLSLEDIKSATDTFSHNKRIGEGGFGGVYKGEVKNANGCVTTIAAKRLNTSGGQGENEFLTELEILLEYNHENVIGLVGYCNDPIEKIIVYEYASRGSLDTHLKDNGLTWMTRLHISIDIARGLDYLHLVGVTQEMVMHRDIKSANILLNDEWRAKISDFGLSLISPVDEETDFVIDHACGTPGYCDPLYLTSGFLTKESDIYSLGVVLFEILCGRLVYEKLNGSFRSSNNLFKHHYEKGTLHEIMLEGIKEQIAPKSLHIFQNIAYQCLHDEKIKRPTTSDVLSQLEKALEFQEDYDKWGPKLPQDYEKLIKMTNSPKMYSSEKKEDLYYMFRKGIILQKGKVVNPNSIHKYSLEDIEVATHNFCDDNLIGKLIFGNIYKGEIIHVNGCKTIAAKRWDLRFGEGETEFLTELEILLEYKHENIISLVGYCNEQAEKIIVTKYASRGSLDTHLKDNDFTWMKRLQISIDIARGLDFLHGGGITQELVIHRDIKSANILLNDDWRAKICNFGLSFISPIDNETNFFIDNICGTPGYIDPLYKTLGLLTKESDIYSLGVVLFEILCGRLVYENVDGSFQSSNNWFKNHYEEGKIDEIMFEGIKEQIAPKSLTVFQNIAYRCLHDEKEKRPTTSDVLSRLEEALKFQKDYEKLVEMPNSLEFHSTKKKDDKVSRKDNGNLQKRKVLFSLDGNGERSEMISAVDFSYKHRLSYKCRSIPESRFQKVAEMSDVSNLNIHVKIKPRFLSPGINYGVNLVFRFCGPRNFAAKWTYVNLKYKKGRETLHTYFATWREDGWMRIELCRFLNQKDDIDFEFLLESFSRCYCKSRVIYIEGIEFRAIDNNVKCKEIKESKEVHQLLIKSDLTMDQVQQLQANCAKEVKRFKRIDEGEKLFLLKEVNEKKHYMLSTKEALYESSDVKLFNLIPSTQSRFPNAVEFLRQQVFRIKFKIESQRLSTNTEYACYIVFKLSEKCHGLHCPVIIRDLLHRKNKEKGILYFRSPSPCNVDDATHVPKEREDGWMEVNVWKFNSSYELRNGCISMILKLISYEGTMSGLIVSGLEFRPM